MAYSTISKPSLHFNTLLYSGNGSNPRTLTGVGFQPDFVWQKNRTDSNGHTLADAVRGANKTLSSDGSGAEVTDKDDGHLDAFTSDGFTVGAGSSSDARVNDGSHTYVAWNWKANGSGSANTDGSINTTSTSVNTTAGFSIVKYTGTAANATVGHGLGVPPKMIITKNLQQGNEGWLVYHASTGNTKKCILNSTGSFSTDATAWNSTTPTNDVFSIGTNWGSNGNGHPMIAYCFAEKKGYSKFGSYTGNGNANGTFVYTGFKPAFVFVKSSSTTVHNWCMMDNKRGYNPDVQQLHPNTSGVESLGSGDTIDLLSNGFKMRATDGDKNGSGTNYIYMAFAEEPLVANVGASIPATAR